MAISYQCPHRCHFGCKLNCVQSDWLALSSHDETQNMNRNIQLNINGIKKNKVVTEQAGELQKRGTTLYQDMARGKKS